MAADGLQLDIKPRIVPIKMETEGSHNTGYDLYQQFVPNNTLIRPEEMKFELRDEDYYAGMASHTPSFKISAADQIMNVTFTLSPAEAKQDQSEAEMCFNDRSASYPAIETAHYSTIPVPEAEKYLNYTSSLPATESHQLNDQNQFNLYRCTRCKDSFSTVELLEAHFEARHNCKPYICCDCGKSYETGRGLAVHQKLQDHANWQNHVCEKCEGNWSILKPLTCPVCPERYSKTQDLSEHLDMHLNDIKNDNNKKLIEKINNELQHLKNAPVKCNGCDKQFQTVSEINSHLILHNGHIAHNCEKCKEIFYSPKALKEHLTTCHDEKDSPEYQTKNVDLNAHVKTDHKPDDSRIFRCVHCDKSYSNESVLKQHEKIHIVDTPLKCDHCQKYFPTKQYLLNHLKNLNGWYSCEHCQMEFCLKKQLKAHARIHKQKATTFKCDHCEKYLSRKDGKEKHLRYSELKHPLVCSHCSCSFMWKCALGKHLKTHDWDKIVRKRKWGPVLDSSAMIKLILPEMLYIPRAPQKPLNISHTQGPITIE